MIRFLVEERGFRTFALEASTPHADRLGAYIAKGVTRLDEQVRRLLSWPWTTPEVLAMAEWIAEHNHQGAGSRVRFTGIDMQSPGESARILSESLRSTTASATANELLKAVRALSKTPRPWSGTLCDLEASEFAGSRVSVSVHVRSAEGAVPAIVLVALEGDDSVVDESSMAAELGEEEAGSWVTHRVEAEIPPACDTVFFMLEHRGPGTLWYDQVEITRDGERFVPDGLDDDFETTIEPFWNNRQSWYSLQLDSSVACKSDSSLKITRTAPVEGSTSEVLALTAALRDSFARELDSTEGIETEASHLVTLIEQHARVYDKDATGYSRDDAMADNILRLLSRDAGQRVIVWAHDEHIRRRKRAFGGKLSEALGPGYLAVGITTSRGTYTAWARGQGRGPHPLLPPPKGSFEQVVGAAVEGPCAVDLRSVDRTSSGAGWLFENTSMRSLGAAASDYQFRLRVPATSFDMVVHIPETAAAGQLVK
ncbi:MAG: erythromycin esterase family protein [Planctomycetota bacterium]